MTRTYKYLFVFGWSKDKTKGEAKTIELQYKNPDLIAKYVAVKDYDDAFNRYIKIRETIKNGKFACTKDLSQKELMFVKKTDFRSLDFVDLDKLLK